jgi:hypothetical protein
MTDDSQGHHGTSHPLLRSQLLLTLQVFLGMMLVAWATHYTIGATQAPLSRTRNDAR